MAGHEDLRQDLLRLESSMLGALAGALRDHGQTVRLRLLSESVSRTYQLRKDRGQLSPTTQQLGARLGERLRDLSRVLHEQHAQRQRIQSDTHSELAALLEDHVGAGGAALERRDATLNATCMRDWFLRNLGHPFPAREDKHRILAASNADEPEPAAQLQYNQVVLWFINTRRRCGWTTFLRKYARGDKARMLELAWALEHEEGGDHDTRLWSAGPSEVHGLHTAHLRCEHGAVAPVPLAALVPHMDAEALARMRDDWHKMVDRIRYGVKERVGDWVEEVIRGPPEPRRA